MLLQYQINTGKSISECFQ